MQRRHSVLRNYPLLGHLRFALERLRPELQQYFIERNFDGRPFDRDTRSIVYARAKGTDAEEPFGAELDLYRAGSEYLTPSMAPRPVRTTPPRVRMLQRVDPHTVRSYAELHTWLTPGQLLASAPPDWASDWQAADPDRFTH